jgi:hypothetical protein
VSHSTDVTTALVPPAFDQMFTLILDDHAAMELGDTTAPKGQAGWECIYKGDPELAEEEAENAASGAAGGRGGRGGRGRGGRAGRGRRPSGRAVGTKKRATNAPSESSLDLALRLELLKLGQGGEGKIDQGSEGKRHDAQESAASAGTVGAGTVGTAATVGGIGMQGNAAGGSATNARQ